MPADQQLRANLFRHISAEKASLYRAVLAAFASAKRQFQLHLRPDDVLSQAQWSKPSPSLDDVQQALAQLVDWGNLKAHPDTARVATVEDFYRSRFLYQLTSGGEAVETGLAAFEAALTHRAELQSVALEDIRARLAALLDLARTADPDPAKVHETLRDLAGIFTSLADNAQAFMAGLAHSIDLRGAETAVVVMYKERLIGYLQRFIGDLVTRSSQIAQQLLDLEPDIAPLLQCAAAREARDAAPDADDSAVAGERLTAWRERWMGLRLWFLSDVRGQAQAERLRARARSAIPQLLSAVGAINERRAGRSDRSADYRVLARWFAEAPDNDAAHRLWRTAFALAPARHLALAPADADVSAATPWAEAPPLEIHPRLRETGRTASRGTPPKVRDRNAERAELAKRLAAEAAQTRAARERLATGRPLLLSELGELDRHAFNLFLRLLGEALTGQTAADAPVESSTGDGLLNVRLEPMAAESIAVIETELGRFAGRDHRITITPVEESA
jgi:uncharacterized protein (TIGR02677 family)